MIVKRLEQVFGAQVERFAEDARNAAEEAQALQQELAAERAARENTERELAQLRVNPLSSTLHDVCGILWPWVIRQFHVSRQLTGAFRQAPSQPCRPERQTLANTKPWQIGTIR